MMVRDSLLGPPGTVSWSSLRPVLGGRAVVLVEGGGWVAGVGGGWVTGAGGGWVAGVGGGWVAGVGGGWLTGLGGGDDVAGVEGGGVLAAVAAWQVITMRIASICRSDECRLTPFLRKKWVHTGVCWQERAFQQTFSTKYLLPKQVSSDCLQENCIIPHDTDYFAMDKAETSRRPTWSRCGSWCCGWCCGCCGWCCGGCRENLS